MRRLAFLSILAAAPQALRAEEAQTPFLIFREADPATAKRIERDLVTEKQLGGLMPAARRQTREDLARIGPLSVPFLATALKKESSARIRLNTVIVLALVRDPRGLPALRGAAKEDDDISVRRAATLAIGTFESPADLDTLKGLPGAPRGEWRSAAPALARLRQRDAGAILKARADPKLLPDDEHDAAATLLAAAIATREVALVGFLEHRQKLVQQAAAAGLLVRPPQRTGEILAALGRTKLAGTARVLAIRALGAIEGAQDALLDIACKDGNADERIAALLELKGSADEYAPLAKAYARIEGRNDPVAAALLLALARTREEKAIATLLAIVRGGGSEQLRFYAAAALLCANGSALLDDTIRREAVALGGEIGLLAQGMAATSEAKRVAALAKLREIKDPRHLRLYLEREERNWLEVNRLVTRIFELDEVLVQFDSSRPYRTEESPLDGGGGSEKFQKAASKGTDEEQDLFDLLIPPRVGDDPPRRPYFGPEDLGGA